MQEKDFNTLLKNSLNEYGYAYKISDQGGEFGTIAKPSDLIFFGKNSCGLIEGKLIKGIYAFNFDRIEDIQWESLLKVSSIKKEYLGLLALYIFIPRKLKIVLFFDINFIKRYKEQNNKSFKQKDLKKFIENNLFVSVGSDKLFNMFDFENKIIKNL